MLSEERVMFLDGCESKNEILRKMSEKLSQTVTEVDCDELIEVLLAREAIMSTGIGLGIAVPHARLASVTHPALGIGISKEGINYESLDDKPVHVVVLIVVPAHSQKQYLRILARVTLMLKNARLREQLMTADSPHEVYRILSEY